MPDFIVYTELRDGTRIASEWMDRERAERIASEAAANGVTAEVFPAANRPKLFAWRHPVDAKRHRVTPGQSAYEEDVRRRPHYDGGAKRPEWAELSDVARWSWDRDPTQRFAKGGDAC